METTLFGLTMSKKRKVRIIVCLMAAVLCLVLYVLASLFYKPVVVVSIPSGGLVKSVFEAQNMNYVKSDSMSKEYHYEGVPYMINTPSGTSASIGTATVVSLNGFYFLYDLGTDAETVVRNGYTDVVVLNAVPADSTIKELKHETGYINGCSADFYAYEFKVVGAEVPQYICIYKLTPSNSEELGGKSLFVGAMSSGYTTENFNNLVALCKANIGTLQYDSKFEGK